MAFTIKIRGAPSRVISAEYLCPTHGRFALDVERDANGDPPEWVHCAYPFDGAAGPVRCTEACQWVISAPLGKVKAWEVVRGGWQKPERETWLDTRNLGEGQELDDWREDRRKIRDRQRERELKELLE